MNHLIEHHPYIATALAAGIGGIFFGTICLVAGLVIGASRSREATHDEPMPWQSDAYSGEK
jgi:hypothetical protein